MQSLLELCGEFVFIQIENLDEELHRNGRLPSVIRIRLEDDIIMIIWEVYLSAYLARQ